VTVDNKLFFWLLACFLLACEAPLKKSKADFGGDIDRYLQFELGDSEEEVRASLGEPNSYNTEKFASKEYKVIEYSVSKYNPVAFYSISGGRVAGKSVWLASNSKNSDLSYLKEKFRHFTFKIFFPCRSSGREEILIDQEKGLSLVAKNGKVEIVMWSDPELTKLRVDSFYEKCPNLQDKRN
jgi:hypothetical protein